MKTFLQHLLMILSWPLIAVSVVAFTSCVLVVMWVFIILGLYHIDSSNKITFGRRGR